MHIPRPDQEEHVARRPREADRNPDRHGEIRLVVSDVTGLRPEPSAQRRPTRSATRPRVLIVTDNRVLCESAAFALDALGFDSNQVVWPDLGAPDEDARRRMMTGNPRAGILFGDLRGPHRLADSVTLVDRLPIRWLLVVGDPRERTWAPFVAAGASSVVPTSTSLDRLARTLLQVMTTDQAGHRAERDRLMTEWRSSERQRDEAVARFASLSPREILVLDRLYDGISVKNIAVIDGVSEATVRTQVKAVLRKLDVSSQLAAVAAYRKVKGDGGPKNGNGGNNGNDGNGVSASS